MDERDHRAALLGPSDRTRLRRQADRGSHDHQVIDAILDEGRICHFGVICDTGPLVLPMAYGRIEDRLYVHGAAANAMLRDAARPPDVCVTVTLLDGLVLSRSWFHHSMNYRSVVIFGQAHVVRSLAEKRDALRAIVDHVAPGRADDARPPTDTELRATRVLRVRIVEASAKVRTGGPIEDPNDLTLGIWAGELPLQTVTGDPMADPQLPPNVAIPAYLGAASAS